MTWAALITWVITAGGGFVLLSIWLSRGGMRQQDTGGSRIRPPLIMSHFLLAATGLVLWIIYLVSDSDAQRGSRSHSCSSSRCSASRCSGSGCDNVRAPPGHSSP